MLFDTITRIRNNKLRLLERAHGKKAQGEGQKDQSQEEIVAFDTCVLVPMAPIGTFVFYERSTPDIAISIPDGIALFF